jgi:TP901 family phage tail tape measure protein
MARIEALFGVKGQKEMSSAFGNIGLKLISVNQGIELAQKAFRALSAPMASVIKEGRDFTAQMSAVRSVSSATKDEMARLTEEARRLGAETAFTATEAGQAMEELGRAGQTTAQILTTTNAALDLANANNVDLAESAKLVAVQMNVFKDTMLTARQAADLINKTVSSAPLNFQSLGYALTFVSGTASAAGWDFKQLTRVLGAMAEAGIEGSKAGRALNTAIARLLKPTAESQKALDKYGISIDDINPTMHDFAEIVDVLNQKQVELKDLFDILGIEAAPKFLKLIKGGGDTIRGFAEKQEKANTALEAARIRLDNLEGDITIYNSAISGLKLSIFETMDTFLREIVQSSTAMVSVFDQFVKNNKGTFDVVFHNIGMAMDFVGDVIEVLVNSFGTLLKTIGTFIANSVSLQAVADNIAEAFDLIVEIARLLSPLIKPLAHLVGTVLVQSWKALWSIFGATANVLQKIVIFGLKELRDLLKGIPEFIDAVAKAMDDAATAIKNLGDDILGLVDSFTKLANKSDAKKALSDLEDGATDLVGSFTKLVKDGFHNVDQSIVDFTRGMGFANDSASELDETLTGNTLSISLKEVGEELIRTGTDLENWKRKVIAVNKAAKEFDQSLKDLADKSGDLLSGDTGGFGSAVLSALSKGADLVKAKISKSFEELTLEDVFKTIGSIMSRLADSVWSLFTSNEKFNAALNQVFDTIGKVLSPIIEAFIPVLNAVNNSINEMAPLFRGIVKDLAPLIKTLIDFLTKLTRATGPIIKGVLERIIPFFQRVMSKLGPSLIKLTESVGPVLNAILDILIPIIDELLPIIKDIIDLIAELNPLIVAILQLVKAFMPIIRAVIRIVSAVVHVIVSILKPIIQVLINIIKIITSVIEGVFRLLEAVFRPIFDALLSVLKILIDTIKNLIGSTFGGSLGGGGKGGGGSLFPGLPGGGGLFGFASGTGALSRDQLLRLPGMESNSGLIKAHVGESIGKEKESGNSYVFNITASDPKGTVNELRSLIEELRIQGKL